jgi:hypothetical protein
MGFVQGRDAIVKVLVAGVSHLGEKWVRVGWVGITKGHMREWDHYNHCKKMNLMGWVPNKGVEEVGWVHKKMACEREVPLR